MDAIHYTKKLKWQLYLLFVYDKCKIWYFVPYMLIKKKDNNIIAIGLYKIYNSISFKTKY